MSKKKVTITLDQELVDLHKLKSPVPLSTDLNNYLKESLLCADELEEVNKQIERLEKKLGMLRPKQARLEQLKVIKINNSNDISACHDTLVRMQEANDGVIGKNQLVLLADYREINYDDLVDYCLENGFNLIEISQPGTKKHKF
ncbi:MAG: hypothetical protein J6T69_07880 [Methanobrevibacter sp.]|nr:hypothetical protein [Methanobrevibacter sp.]